MVFRRDNELSIEIEQAIAKTSISEAMEMSEEREKGEGFFFPGCRRRARRRIKLFLMNSEKPD